MIESNTPMMRQYKEVKEKHPDAFLFFRCGDFYEMFGPDAVEASKILNITLTKRGDVPMCGVPYHAVEGYSAKILAAGRKVAICEQLEDPKLAKGIVKRDVENILTPGTIVDGGLLNNKSNNFLLALNKKGIYLEFAVLDLSTGDFEFNEIDITGDFSIFKGELVRIAPKEILVPEDLWTGDERIRSTIMEYENILINRFPLWYFESEENDKIIANKFGTEIFGEIEKYVLQTNFTTPCAILKYVSENIKGLASHIWKINFNNNKKTMILDESTVKNLELIKNLQDGTSINSLLEVLDNTSTPMGGRLLKKMIVEPLLFPEDINKRLDIVEFFIKNQNVMDKIEREIKNIMDLERLISRIAMDRANPKDLVSLKNSLIYCKNIEKLIENVKPLAEFHKSIENLDNIIDYVEKTIKEEPSAVINEGNIVREGYNKKLDELRDLSFKTKEIMNSVELEEREKFNTPTLRIKYNKILGYFFEVSKLQSKNIPESYILRQNLVNVNRYTSKTLSEYESKILNAREEINLIEQNIFFEARDAILKEIRRIQTNAKIIAQIDVLISYANVSLINRYTRPIVTNGDSIIIKKGRHPVVEKKIGRDDFIDNDLEADNDKDFFFIITGPNMSGKSTYLRQTALIVLLAQIGMFVPAMEARIGVVDRIFTRIGASDNLARGQSTFLVEMSETANILKNATNKSLIIMDEIGRGTSTFDGLSIAWACVEYITDKKYLGAKTLFATHYHELTKLSDKKGIKNLSVAISEDGEDIIFLHKIIEKPSEKSYGIHVAKIAQMPKETITLAENILAKLENKEFIQNKVELVKNQYDLFDFSAPPANKDNEKILNDLKYLDLDRIAPLQALNILSDYQKKLKK